MARARRMVSSALGLSAPRSPFGRTLRFCLRAAIVLWGVELAFADPEIAVGPVAGAVSLGFTLLAAVALGTAFGLAALLLRDRSADADGVALARMLPAKGDVPAHHAALAGLWTLMLLVPLLAAAGFLVAQLLIGGIARAHFAALAVVGAHLVLVLLGALLWPRVRGLCASMVGRLAGVPALAPLVADVTSILRMLAAVALLVVILVGRHFWSVLQFLPWGVILPLVSSVLAALGLGLLVRGRRVPALIEGVVFIVAVAVGSVALVTLDSRGSESRRAIHSTVGGRSGYAVALALLDFDRDGHLHVLGGRDCAPFDARRSPVAPDIPGNGIDEDCDGADLDVRKPALAAPKSWPLPDGFPNKPPIVLITIDAFAANRLAVLGGKRGNTKHIDALARQGVLFRAAFSQGPSTRLSFPSIMTSRFDTQIRRSLEGKHPFNLEPSETTMAEVMARGGYFTAAIVSDHYFTRERWASITDGFEYVTEGPARANDGGRHNSKEVTDAALKVLGRHEPNKPIFLWVHYFDAHWPHRQPADGPHYGKSREDAYDAEVALVDREVGRLVDGIHAKLGEGVVIALTADHGIAFDLPRHRVFNYGYDIHSSVLHVPMIFTGPKVKRGMLDGAVSTMDVAPTLANLAGIRRKLPFEGSSLVPEIFEGRSERPQRLVHQFYINERRLIPADPLEKASLRTERYHLIHDRRIDAYELYEWRKDYYERNDLASAPERAEVFDALRQQLAAHIYHLHTRRDWLKPPATAHKKR